MSMLSLVMDLLIIVTIIVPSTFAGNLSDGLVGYWNFDGNTEDSSGNKYDGEVNGNVTYGPGKFGQTISIENEDKLKNYVAITNSVDIQLTSTNKYTVSLYVRPSRTRIGELAWPQDILYHGLFGSSWASWFLGIGGGELNANLKPDHFVFGVREANNGFYTGVVAKAFAGVWSHVSIIFDINVLKLYINGVKIDSIMAKLPYDCNEKLYIGGNPGVPTCYIGLIDDLRIYNRALNENEIIQLMEGAKAVSTSNKLSVTWGTIKQE